MKINLTLIFGVILFAVGSICVIIGAVFDYIVYAGTDEWNWGMMFYLGCVPLIIGFFMIGGEKWVK